MVELGYTQAVDIKLIADSQDNRKGHYGEDNNIYLNDTNLNNTKDLATFDNRILSLTLINPCIILIVVVNKLLISLSFCWCVA
jgi:hypothetical protein